MGLRLTRLDGVLAGWLPVRVVNIEQRRVAEVDPEGCILELPPEGSVGLVGQIETCVMGVLKDAVLWRRHRPLDRRRKDRVGATDGGGPAASCRQRIARRVSVADDANPLSVGLVGGEAVVAELTRASDVLSAHPVASISGDSLIGMNDDTVALANTDGERVGGEGSDWHKIGRDNLKQMVVNGEVEMEVGSAVDDVDEILLAPLERLFEVVTTAIGATGTVDNDRVGRWGSSSIQRVMESLVGILVVPVGDDDGRPFLIPGVIVRSMDEQRSGDTVGVLRAVVRVIPSRAVLSDAKLVGEGIALCDWALRDA